jgi:dTDP-glucose pyrophosphorylase
MINYRSHLILTKTPIKEALTQLTSLGIDAILFVIDKDDKLIGSITDGDIRRGLINGISIDEPIDSIIRQAPKFIEKGNYDLNDIIKFREENYRIIPVLDHNNCVINIINFRHLYSYLPLDAVIMAGGRGQRLSPLTDTIPKPLLKVGDKSIIQHNIDRLSFFGIDDYWISINYLGDMIKHEVGSGNEKNININYITEKIPLGTLGAISNINEFKHDHILVTNSDVLTNLDYEDFYLQFLNNNADMAVVTIPYEVKIPYAVLETKNSSIISLKEKPTFTYYSNAGIYLIKRALLKYIPKGVFYNTTDLIETLIADNKKVFSYPMLGYWLDIGNPEDYIKANNDIKNLKL